MSRLLIFDCDGTLVDSEVLAAKVFPAVWSSMGVSMTSDYFLCNFVGTGDDAPIVRKTMALLPQSAKDIADKQFDEELSANLESVQGMAELLRSIHFDRCVASNSSLNYVKRALSKTLLDVFFGERVYSSRDVGKPKPSPDIFLHAARVNGYAPADCIVIEDSVSGIKAAQNAGMYVIGFMGGKHFKPVVRDRLLTANADLYCSSVIELKEALLR